MSLFDPLTINVIAEIGVNHEGNIKNAIKMLELAATTGIKAVKFQAYTPTLYASASDQQRLELVSKFSLNENDFKILYDSSKNLNVEFLCTPLTEDWVEKLNPYVKVFKIASGDITFEPVIKNAAKTGKQIILSTGTATLQEIDQAIKWVEEAVGKEAIKERLILMHCVSAYPTPIEEANILSIPFLKERYGLRVGYSNHVIGIDASLAAVALGADIIEIHFTDCKEGREFRDHALSFDLNDLKTFMTMAGNIKKSLGQYGKEPQPCEKISIPAMRKGIIASKELKTGQILTKEDLMFARPATQFAANELNVIIGKQLKKDIPKGYLITKDSI